MESPVPVPSKPATFVCEPAVIEPVYAMLVANLAALTALSFNIRLPPLSPIVLSSKGTLVACSFIVPEFPILLKDSLTFLNSAGVNVPPLLGRARPILSLIFPLPSKIWVFNILVSAKSSKALPFHLGNLPAVFPNKDPAATPNPPFVTGTIPARLARDGATALVPS